MGNVPPEYNLIQYFHYAVKITITHLNINSGVCCITKATNTLRVCNIAFLLQQRFQERTSVLRYMYIPCLVFQFCMFKRIVLTDNKETDNININRISHILSKWCILSSGQYLTSWNSRSNLMSDSHGLFRQVKCK